ncbi:TetR family transcriptional regulator [Nonomuraea sp. NPDC052265]
MPVAGTVFGVVRRAGFEQASLRNVAEEAGLAIGSVRHYFAGHTELIAR